MPPEAAQEQTQQAKGGHGNSTYISDGILANGNYNRLKYIKNYYPMPPMDPDLIKLSVDGLIDESTLELWYLLCHWPEISISESMLLHILERLISDNKKRERLRRLIQSNNIGYKLNSHFIAEISHKIEKYSKTNIIDTFTKLISWQADNEKLSNIDKELMQALSYLQQHGEINLYQKPISVPLFMCRLFYLTFCEPIRQPKGAFRAYLELMPKDINTDDPNFLPWISHHLGLNSGAILLCKQYGHGERITTIFRLFLRIYRLMALGFYEDIQKDIKKYLEININGITSANKKINDEFLVIQQILLSRLNVILYNIQIKSYSFKNKGNNYIAIPNANNDTLSDLTEKYHIATCIEKYTHISDDFNNKDYVVSLIHEMNQKSINMKDPFIKYHYLYIMHRFIEYVFKKFEITPDDMGRFKLFLDDYKKFLTDYTCSESTIYYDLLLSNSYLSIYDINPSEVCKIMDSGMRGIQKSKISLCRYHYQAACYLIKKGEFYLAERYLQLADDNMDSITNESMCELMQSDVYANLLKCYFYFGSYNKIRVFINNHKKNISKLINYEFRNDSSIEEKRYHVNNKFYILLQLFYYYSDILNIKKAKKYLNKMREMLISIDCYPDSDRLLFSLREEQLNSLDGTIPILTDDKTQEFEQLFRERPLYIQYTYDTMCYQIESLLSTNSIEIAMRLLSLEHNDAIPEPFKKSPYFIRFYALKVIACVQVGNFNEIPRILLLMDQMLKIIQPEDSIMKVYHDYAKAYYLYHSIILQPSTRINNKLNECVTLIEKCIIWFQEHHHEGITTLRLHCQLLQAHLSDALGHPDQAKNQFETMIETLSLAHVATPFMQAAKQGLASVSRSLGETVIDTHHKLDLISSDRELQDLIVYFKKQHAFGLITSNNLHATLEYLSSQAKPIISSKLHSSTLNLIHILKKKIKEHHCSINSIIDGHAIDLEVCDNDGKKYLISALSDLIACYMILGEFTLCSKILNLYCNIANSIKINDNSNLSVNYDFNMILDFKLALFVSSKDIEDINDFLQQISAANEDNHLSTQLYIIEHNANISKYIFGAISTLLGNHDDSQLMDEAITKLKILSEHSYTSLAELFVLLLHGCDKVTMLELYEKNRMNIDNMNVQWINFPIGYADAEKVILPPAIRNIVDAHLPVEISPVVLMLFSLTEILNKEKDNLLFEDIANQLLNNVSHYPSSMHWYLYLCFAYKHHLPYKAYLSNLDMDYTNLFDAYTKKICFNDRVDKQIEKSKKHIRLESFMPHRIYKDATVFPIEDIFYVFHENIVNQMSCFFRDLSEKFNFEKLKHDKIRISLKAFSSASMSHECIKLFLNITDKFKELFDLFDFSINNEGLIISCHSHKRVFNALKESLKPLLVNNLKENQSESTAQVKQHIVWSNEIIERKIYKMIDKTSTLNEYTRLNLALNNLMHTINRGDYSSMSARSKETVYQELLAVLQIKSKDKGLQHTNSQTPVQSSEFGFMPVTLSSNTSTSAGHDERAEVRIIRPLSASLPAPMISDEIPIREEDNSISTRISTDLPSNAKVDELKQSESKLTTHSESTFIQRGIDSIFAFFATRASTLCCGEMNDALCDESDDKPKRN